ncbi:glycosyltransferase family 2 protein [Weissella sp. GP1]|uniref:glycosyltransferase family 2 protein n=1 Tax=Weissella confusa TaxID=1583 RepID=UPI0032DB268D
MSAALVSVIIPTKDRIHYLKKAIESVESQKEVNVEIIVIDDGSTDGTLEYLDNKGIKVLHGDGGPGINRRKAFEFVTGSYVVFLDDDDFYTDECFFNKSIDCFEKNPSIGTVYFNSRVYYQTSQITDKKVSYPFVGLQKGVDVIAEFMTKYPKPNSTFPAMFSVSKLQENGILDMETLNDTQIYIRGFVGGDVYIDDSSVGIYRVHTKSIGNLLSIDFIIQNLEEKTKLAVVLPPEINKNDWLKQQLWITLQYYAARSKVFEYQAIREWIVENELTRNMNLLKLVRKERFKYYLKTMLSKKNAWQKV